MTSPVGNAGFWRRVIGWRPRFSMRTLLILVAIAAVAATWIGWNVRQVNERKELFDTPGVVWSISPAPPDESLPWLWTLLGAKPVNAILVHPAVPEDLYQRFVAAFPEAEVRRESSGIPNAASPR